MNAEIELLARAHALFAGHPPGLPRPRGVPVDRAPQPSGVFARAYARQAAVRGVALADAEAVDAHLMRVVAEASVDHAEARRSTGTVLAAARLDTVLPDNPLAAREFLRRRALRLRAQRRHLAVAARRARYRRAALRALRYRLRQRSGPGRDVRVAAVRAAMTRLGCPYVWGAAGPDRFDCSGLVKWAYAQAGVPLHRTTFEQIGDGVPVPRSQVAPGDLVFPHAGHVQLAIGSGLVIEAPYAGAAVRISPMGSSVAIRRPL